MTSPASILLAARERAGLSQRQLAARAGTSQPAVARAEGGHTGITVETLRRLLQAADFDLILAVEPRRPDDPVTAAYRRDVDQTLLRENLRRSVDDRLRTAAETVEGLRELARATQATPRRRPLER